MDAGGWPASRWSSWAWVQPELGLSWAVVAMRARPVPSVRRARLPLRCAACNEREHDVARVTEVVAAVLFDKAGDPVALVEDVVEVHG